MDPFKIIGALGLLAITIGIVTKGRQRQDVLYIIGGIGLEAYSLYLGDVIFIILQIVFTAAAAFDLYRLQSRSPRSSQ